jgi:hypothetical protein
MAWCVSTEHNSLLGMPTHVMDESQELRSYNFYTALTGRWGQVGHSNLHRNEWMVGKYYDDERSGSSLYRLYTFKGQ